jgi:putative chitinase
MKREAFFNDVRASFGSLSQPQVDGFNLILDEGLRRKIPLYQEAYILATVWHETASQMQPIREMGGEKYLKSKPYYPWVGEGYVQVTWEANHRKFGATAPGQLLHNPIAMQALYDGMLKGMFTTKRLSDYINNNEKDYVNARRIVNGVDKASMIATYAEKFETALKHALWGSDESVVVPMPPPVERPPIAEPQQPRGILKAIIDLLMAIFGKRK